MKTLKWLLLSVTIGFLAGIAAALFLRSLDLVTGIRESHPWLIAFLPAAGFAIGWTYHRYGRAVEAGNNLVLDEIHDPRQVIPWRMAPLVLFGSLITHLFGGSAGREGTAIQMGASLADQLCKPFKLLSNSRKIVLMAGMSGGFAGVFGTPFAGTIFGMEVLAIGEWVRLEALMPCFIAAAVAHLTVLAMGVHHTIYTIPLAPSFTFCGISWAILAGALFGLVGMAFGHATHTVSRLYRNVVAYPPLRPVIGGILVAGLVWAMHSTRYIGLGIPVIRDAFVIPLSPWDWIAKFAMTVLTLGAGFKGGEVTPLFFIGATLGNALSRFASLPVGLLAGMGFAGVFAGAANTPLACTLMGIELFGRGSAAYLGIACLVSYLFSGHAGIYRSQRVLSPKLFKRLRDKILG